MSKRISRIYINQDIKINTIITLNLSHRHYIIKVLRMKIKDKLEVFNNTNYIFLSTIISIQKKNVTILIINKEKKNIESPLFIHLGLAISKNTKMNFAIQKSVELGVHEITPIFSQYCNINKNNISNKIISWKNIIIAACQQCQRNIIPKINYAEELYEWCKKKNNIYETKIVLDAKSNITVSQLPQQIHNIQLLIGCEGGFSSLELEEIMKNNFISIKLGPRILRTETAAIAAVTMLQMKFGDLIN